MQISEFQELVVSALAGWKGSEAAPALPPLAAFESADEKQSEERRTLDRGLPELLAPAAIDIRQSPRNVSSDAPLQASVLDSRLPDGGALKSAPAVSNIERLVAEQLSLRPVPRTSSQEEKESAATRSKAAKSASTESSLAESVLRTAGLVTGLGPLIAGLAGLFGSAGSETPALPPLPFVKPESLGLEAGLDRNRAITQIGYKQDGSSYAIGSSNGIDSPLASRRTDGSQEQLAVPQPAQQTKIEITVHAMDSRSFLDHSDDIARAVQQAMLRSHPLNDVVSEL